MDGLREAGAQLHMGHSVSNVERNNKSSLPDAIVVSSAIPQDNPEILHAKCIGIPVCVLHTFILQILKDFSCFLMENFALPFNFRSLKAPHNANEIISSSNFFCTEL